MSGKILSMLTACTVTAAAVAAAPAQAVANASTCTDTPVTTGAVFNDPAGGDPAALVRELCGLVRQAPAGSRIQLAHFVMSGTAGGDFAAELIRAHQRGVDVQVVLDGDTRGAAVATRLKGGLGADPAARSWVHVCTGPPSGGTAACIGDKGQHNKFYLFSRTGTASDVVVQSSANLTDVNSSTYWNNLVVLPGDRRLFAAYSSYFGDLAAERKNPGYYRVTDTHGPSGSVRAHFFPRAGADTSTDPVVENLDQVSCQGGTTIRVGMSEWDAYRIGVAAKLAGLAAQGCTVRIVYGTMADETRTLLLAEPGVELRTLGEGSALPGRVHSKYLLIEGAFGGERDARRVFTGSHNYNRTSLRHNDDALLRLDNPGVYQQYVANFERMRAVAPRAAAS
jgi:hypothetical protein